MSVPAAPALERPSGLAVLAACRPVLLLILATVLACAPAWLTLTGIWQDSFSYAHGWLIALVSLLLLAEVAPHLAPSARAQGGPIGALALAALAYGLAEYGHIDLAQQLLLPVLPVLLLASVYGWRGARRTRAAWR